MFARLSQPSGNLPERLENYPETSRKPAGNQLATSRKLAGNESGPDRKRAENELKTSKNGSCTSQNKPETSLLVRKVVQIWARNGRETVAN